MSKGYNLARSIIRCFAVAGLLLGTGPVLATADGPDFYSVTGVADDDVLNIRAQPNPHAEKIGTIPADGTCVRNLGCQGGLTFEELTELSGDEKAKRLKENPRWCGIEYRNVTGWVAGRYLEEDDCGEGDQPKPGRAEALRPGR